MSNICDNTFYAESQNRENLDTILKFFDKHFPTYALGDDSEETIELYFESKWSFPESLMNDLYNLIPDKSDIYMRCLSVEYGCMYHALWYCDEDGWHEC